MTASDVRRIATLAASATVLAVVVWRVDPRRVIHDFEGARPGFVIATVLLNLANTGIEAVRWRLLAKPVAPHVRLRSTFQGLLAGTVGNVVLPLKLGDGVRAYVFSEAEGLPLAVAASTVVFDRMLDISAFVVLAMLTALVAPLPGSAMRVVTWSVAGVTAGIAILFAMTRRPRAAEPARPVRPGRVAAEFDRFRSGLSALRSGRLLVPAAAAAAMSWTLKTALTWTMLQAFHLSLPLAAPAVALVVVNLGIAVAGTPGNVGSFELASMGALALFSVPGHVALSFATALHVTEVLPVVALALVMMGTRRPSKTVEGGSSTFEKAARPDSGDRTQGPRK